MMPIYTRAMDFMLTVPHLLALALVGFAVFGGIGLWERRSR
jgi:hypothetical protein